MHARLVGSRAGTNATLFMVMHAALAVLLARLSRQRPTSRSAPRSRAAARRHSTTWSACSSTPWCCAPRWHADASFAELLRRVRETDLAAFGNADVPFERLVEVLNPVRSTARHPLFQVMLAFQNLRPIEFELLGLSVSGLDIDTGMARFDLDLTMMDRYDEEGRPIGISGSITYATDLFDEATARAIRDRLLRVIAAIVADPMVVVGDIDLLGPTERVGLVSHSGGAPEAARTLPEMLAAAVRCPRTVRRWCRPARN